MSFIMLNDSYGNQPIKLEIAASRVTGNLYVTATRNTADGPDVLLDGSQEDIHEVAAFFKMVDEAKADFEINIGRKL